MQEGSIFSTPSPSFVLCGLSNDGHSDWCEAVSHGNFDLHFSNNQGCGTFFHVLVGHLYIFLGETSIQVFCQFFSWVVGFVLLLGGISSRAVHFETPAGPGLWDPDTVPCRGSKMLIF